MQVREIMATGPVTCGSDAGLEEVARKMVEADCGMIPILDEGQKPLGVVTDRDITCRAVANGRDPLELSARDVMTAPSVTTSPDADVEECAQLLEEHQSRRIVVADDSGRCCGVVAQADLARQASAEKAAEVVREVSQPSQEASRVH